MSLRRVTQQSAASSTLRLTQDASATRCLRLCNLACRSHLIDRSGGGVTSHCSQPAARRKFYHCQQEEQVVTRSKRRLATISIASVTPSCSFQRFICRATKLDEVTYLYPSRLRFSLLLLYGILLDKHTSVDDRSPKPRVIPRYRAYWSSTASTLFYMPSGSTGGENTSR